MSPLPITLACGDYDRTQGLKDGSVPVEGVQLNFVALPPEEIFWRALKYQEFDVCEMSMCNHIMQTAKGIAGFTGIPVFPSRLFRHSSIFINKDKGIVEPKDLIGKRVGAPEYHMTALLWIRGMLQHDYGVKAADVHWVLAGLEKAGREDRVPFQMPSHLSWEARQEDTLNAMLERGEIDAVLTAKAPSCFLRGATNVGRLFPNYVEVEKAYYQRTGLFPIMHTVAIRNDVYKANPWLAQSMNKAFENSKEHARKAMWDTGALQYMIPWLIPILEDQQSVFGPDSWPYGLAENRHNLTAMTQYAFEQGLTDRLVGVEELFAPSTLSEAKL